MKGGARKHERSPGRLCFFEQNLAIHVPTHNPPPGDIAEMPDLQFNANTFSCSEQSGQLFSVCYVLKALRSSVSRLNCEEIQ